MSKHRIIGFDLARALAVIGMVVVNFKIATGAETNGPAWLVSLVGLLSGRAAATFVVLAGVGIGLMSARARREHDPAKLAACRGVLGRRALFLLVAGLAFVPIWPADILHFYAFYIAFSVLFLTASTRVLVWSIIGLMAGYVALFFTLDYDAGWNWKTYEYADFWEPRGFVRHLFFNGFHPVCPWLSFLLLGLLVSRLDFGDPRTRRQTLGWALGVALGAELLSRVLLVWAPPVASMHEHYYQLAVFGSGPMPPMPLYLIAAGATAVVVITLCVILGERYGERRLLWPLIATGQLALTLYAAHVVLGLGALEAMGRLEDQTLVFALSSAALFCLAGVIAATLWRAFLARGPLEIVMRRLCDFRSKPPS